MNRSGWAQCCVGAWIAGSVCMTVVATQNFHTVDRLLADSQSPAFQSFVQELGSARTRDLLRYLSSELNRLYFHWWNVAQVVLGALLLWLTAGLSDARRLRWLLGAMLAVVVVMLVWMTPEITTLGRRLDFVPREPPPEDLGRFWTLHAAYTVLELAKLAGAIAVGLLLFRVPVQSQDSEPEL